MLDETGIIDDMSLLHDIVNVPLTNNSMACLLELLDFAERASRVMVELELQQGKMAAAKKMKMYGDNAMQLADIIYKHLDIGEPIRQDRRN